MPQTQIMSLDEKLAICAKARKIEEEGNKEEALRIMIEEYPMPPYMAKWAKKRMGADFLIKQRYNLEEANVEFGPDWLNR